jgi:hypothetical protein
VPYFQEGLLKMKAKIAKLGLVYVCLTIISLITFTGTCYGEIDPESIMAMWLFEDGSGKIAEDSSGNGNDADITGAKFVDGKFGKALSFAGSDFVEAKTFNNVDGKFGKHSYMFWAKQKGLGSEIPFNAGSTRVLNVHFNESPNSILVGYSGMTGDWLRIAGVWIADEWHHVAVTYDGKKMIAYMDAKAVGERATAVGPPAEAGSFMMGRFLGGSYSYNGLLDEVVVFNVAIEQKDIETIMNKGIEVAEGGNAVSSAKKLATTWGIIKNR